MWGGGKQTESTVEDSILQQSCATPFHSFSNTNILPCQRLQVKQDRYFRDFCAANHQFQRLLFQLSVFMKQKAPRVRLGAPWYAVELFFLNKKKIKFLFLSHMKELWNLSRADYFLKLSVCFPPLHSITSVLKQDVFHALRNICSSQTPRISHLCRKIQPIPEVGGAITLLNHFKLFRPTNKPISKANWKMPSEGKPVNEISSFISRSGWKTGLSHPNIKNRNTAFQYSERFVFKRYAQNNKGGKKMRALLIF